LEKLNYKPFAVYLQNVQKLIIHSYFTKFVFIGSTGGGVPSDPVANNISTNKRANSIGVAPSDPVANNISTNKRANSIGVAPSDPDAHNI